MHPTEDVAKSGPGLQRRFALVAGDGNHAGHGLDRYVHRQIIPMRSALPITRCGRVYKPWIQRRQRFAADQVAFHRSRRKILDKHVRVSRKFFQ